MTDLKKPPVIPEIQKLLPQSPEAEQGLISSFLLAPREVGGLCAEHHITEADFHLEKNRTIYRHLAAAWAANESIDSITLTQKLRDAHELDAAGGHVYVTEVATYWPTAANAGQYVEIIKEKSALRRLYAACDEYRTRALDEQADAPNLILAAQQAIAGVTIRGPVERKTFRAMLLETVDSIERGDDATADILSGIESLDNLVRMRRGNFIVIGGETKSGKTALAGCILAHAAVRQEKRVAVFSLEMNATEIIKRCIASEGRVNVAMIGRQPSAHEISGVVRAVTALQNADIELVCDTNDFGSIVARARQLHAKRPLDLIVLDYLQRAEFTTGRRSETRQEIMSQISRTCKQLAVELNCVFIAISQLNDDGKLRESRAIGQDANAVIAVEKEEDGGRVLRVVAQRNGASGVTAAVQWIPHYTRFETK